MDAELLLRERYVLDEDAFAELVVWRVEEGVRGSDHTFKYRLALIERGVCVLRYDNEAGKGDHRHVGRKQASYRFRDPETLLADFWSDVDKWRNRR